MPFFSFFSPLFPSSPSPFLPSLFFLLLDLLTVNHWFIPKLRQKYKSLFSTFKHISRASSRGFIKKGPLEGVPFLRPCSLACLHRLFSTFMLVDIWLNIMFCWRSHLIGNFKPCFVVLQLSIMVLWSSMLFWFWILCVGSVFFSERFEDLVFTWNVLKYSDVVPWCGYLKIHHVWHLVGLFSLKLTSILLSFCVFYLW